MHRTDTGDGDHETVRLCVVAAAAEKFGKMRGLEEE